jgi:hypothetical protein
MTPEFKYALKKINRENKSFHWYFGMIIFATLLPYLGSIFIFLPQQFLGFNWTGIAWVTMMLVSLFYLGRFKLNSFPVRYWLPWIVYLFGYIIYQFSFVGLQLSLQYTLPILVGVVMSTFLYTPARLKWMFRQFLKLIAVVYALFVYYTVLHGFTPAMAATPMLFSVMGAIFLGLFFVYRQPKFLMGFFLLMLMPVSNLTRMGILVFLVIYLLHFANKSIRGRILVGTVGVVLAIAIFNLPSFQEKTFYYGSGNITDLSLDYYDNMELNSSGRLSWLIALEQGLEQRPMLGNGPRADNEQLTLITGLSTGEAHNDYLSVRFNYGYVGLGLLLFGFAGTFWTLYKGYRRYKEPNYQVVITSTLTLFASFLLFMYSDNILKYTIYFPFYFFALVGIASSMLYAVSRPRVA